MYKYKKSIAVKEEEWLGYIQEGRENPRVINRQLADRLLGLVCSQKKLKL
jgi:hypothetical protein